MLLMATPSFGQNCEVIKDVTIFKFCDSISFEWDPNTEQDIAGYRVYRSSMEGGWVSYSTDPNTPNFVEATAHPIVTLTVNNVPPGLWFWTATAFDTAGNESGFSNHVVSYHIGYVGSPGEIISTPSN